MYITRQMLRKAGMGHNQRVAFRNEWPNGVEVSRDSLELAVGLGLYLHYFALGLFLSNQLSYEEWGTFQLAGYEAEEVYSRDKEGCSPYYPYHGRAAVRDTYQQATITALLSAIQTPRP